MEAETTLLGIRTSYLVACRTLRDAFTAGSMSHREHMSALCELGDRYRHRVQTYITSVASVDEMQAFMKQSS